jgi:hypothetical protein
MKGGAGFRRIRVLASPCAVAAGILPAVEPGVSPGGVDVRLFIVPDASNASPGGKMPPSTAGRMPAATWERCPDAPPCPQGENSAGLARIGPGMVSMEVKTAYDEAKEFGA